MLKKVSIVIFSLLFIYNANAAIIFSPAVSYIDQKAEIGTNPEVSNKTTLIDLNLGYVFDFGLYVGGLYSIQDIDFTNSSDSYMGPSVGYYYNGFMVSGTYYIYGEKDLTDGSRKYVSVSGYQVDISYVVPITKTIMIGPQMTYHNYEYDTEEVGGFEQPAELTYSSWSPYFKLLFMF